MRTPQLKSFARRGTMLSVAIAVLAAVVVPALSVSVFADELNPLTERSLLLSSSAPGYKDTDGSGNSVSQPNPSDGSFPNNYAPAGSGPNGKKTGETFTFRVSTDSAAEDRPIRAFTFQYCTDAAGVCQAPGDNAGDARIEEGEAGARLGNEDEGTETTSDLDVNFTNAAVAGTDYKIFMGEGEDRVDVSAGWTINATNVEDDGHSEALTGKRNFITLSSTTGIEPVFNEQITIVFEASETYFITNPGSGSFFVKINTYDSASTSDHIPATPALTNTHIIDGGVTVANVMTDSIHITTKVLETMSFSVGTRNPDTTTLGNHGTCDNILQINNNRLDLGDVDAEFSLKTSEAYDAFSYWRLSSNSSGGASVYYSGNTLANTVGDEIAEIGASAEVSTPGTEQFGLGFVDAGADTVSASFQAKIAEDSDRYRLPSLYVLGNGGAGTTDDHIVPAYSLAEGTITGPDQDTPATASFAFEKASLTEPRLLAQNSDEVISCDTAKIRYVANIGADTPAGVYTTKINYLAAPQY